MTEEIIGEVGTPGANREWIATQAALAIRQIIEMCGEAPPKRRCELRASSRCPSGSICVRRNRHHDIICRKTRLCDSSLHLI